MDDLTEEFVEWLSRSEWSWTHFLTLTYRYPRTTGVCITTKKLATYAARTAKNVWGFSFAEPHHDGTMLHAHCLWSIQPNLLGCPKEYDLWNWWHRRYGRNVIDRLWTSDSVKKRSKSEIIQNLANYLAKYISKSHRHHEWDFFAFTGKNEWSTAEFAATTGLSWPSRAQRVH